MRREVVLTDKIPSRSMKTVGGPLIEVVMRPHRLAEPDSLALQYDRETIFCCPKLQN
jgi:hypothetical protein